MRVRKILVWMLGALMLCLVAAGLLLLPYYRLLTQTMQVSPARTILPFFGPKLIDDKATVLVLGIGGGNHDGPNLSDSISVMSYDARTNQLKTLGVPRDIWSEPLQEKINAAYALGEGMKPGRGMTLAKAELSSVVGIPIQHAVIIDFAGFKKVVDYLGGVDVVVEHAFTDPEFPIEGKENDECGGDPEYRCRYESISFRTGPQHMDGATALKFVRSRHASGGQGSDFARAKRQQQVVQGVRAKVLHHDFLLDSSRVEGLYDVLNGVVKRDLPNQEAAYLLKRVLLSKNNFSQTSQALSEDLFEVPPVWEFGRYVLIPKDSDAQAIKTIARSLLGFSPSSE